VPSFKSTYREPEARLATAGPETEESSLRPLEQVFGKRSRVLPVPKAGSMVVRTATHGNHESGDYQSRHDEDLSKAKPELGFAEAVDMKNLEPC
jgi:hypothetical protein